MRRGRRKDETIKKLKRLFSHASTPSRRTEAATNVRVAGRADVSAHRGSSHDVL